MATLTKNLFFGSGSRDYRLDVVEGSWPADADGYVFVVGPDKRRPGGHWFVEHGLLTRIAMRTEHDGTVEVRLRTIDTPMARLRDKLPSLFRRALVLEVSPFGFSNLANTNVQAIEGRLFVGYDVGRPIEVNPRTMRFETVIGRADEWETVLPGLVDPLTQVAAHPAPAYDERALYFVNYVQIPLPGSVRGTYVARFGLDGSFERRRIVGLPRYDSIHDVKASRSHLVIADLPFVIEPEAFRGGKRTKAAQDVTQLFILRKDALEGPGDDVCATVVKLPIGTGHLHVDEDDAGGKLTVYLQHIPAADLMLTCGPSERSHADGRPMEPEYEGLPFLGMQPTLVGRYVIDAATGEVLERALAYDEGFWGGVLHTQNLGLAASRARARNWFFGAMGWDPALVPETGWELYRDYANAVVPMDSLPTSDIPGALARFDLDAMRVSDVHRYPRGTFPHPPTFVPRRDCRHDLDGYVVTIVHKDGDKEVQVFDAAHVGRGPIARATCGGFNPPLQLHSCHLDPSLARDRGRYRVEPLADSLAALRFFGPARAKQLMRWSRDVLRGRKPRPRPS